ncbi:hypothetical protein SERLA73DRAFT_92105 [Serpula lacrymans var. lacrymans S7.3]|uniref:NEDD8-activating enzyme E1 regulatory subunit n=2 Tax=Serpula lacrymans var. lacrymans TaxID=341189 RepID=F8Q3N9_SERL3|nr:uncharacterized protein SERLADRAFT_450484 [Serpula lacrymans var. lacrymans S7.9]EGN97124.1 hypothetical protein SERLA73DRAFT_92105 [Serpula lacrymans var. lacrymans S7.3]EGO22733.1 hypothetical protein SERLADRAFT_450484 [Serpula lacrymans var. lacrymans S7.9]
MTGSSHEFQDIEEATTALQSQPDNKTRRYDRQLRLWAASGQSALESSRILVISASATSSSVLKNLVLPGIGHFTILDHASVSHSDAGNNFFLEGFKSIGKSRAEEAVRLLSELNDGVEGKADTRTLESILDTQPEWFATFTLVITHNLEQTILEKLSSLLWSDDTYPPLAVIRSAGFLAEFFIQFHEHNIIESHSETSPSLRIDKPFPALLEHALSLDLSSMDPTEHGHIPYVTILVRALEDWKKKHDGNPPKSYAEKKEFKQGILALKVKYDEENFDEAEAQAYRCWSETKVPSEISALFSDPRLASLGPTSPPFFHLLAALRDFTLLPPYALPLSPTLPDMKSDTNNYIHLQRLYKTQAEEEKRVFKSLLTVPIEDSLVDSLVKNAHALQIMQGKKWGTFDSEKSALVNSLSVSPKETSTHLALSALFTLLSRQPDIPPTEEALRTEIQSVIGQGVELPEQLDDALGEIVRAPTAELPNVAAFLGGMVAQEVIKIITKQYVPANGYCVIDLIETWTGVIGN